MADGVQIQLERMVPELLEYATVGVFNVDEVKRIVGRRRNFEYLIALKSPQLKHFLEYVQFEISLDTLHRHRRAKQELASTAKDFVGFARVRKIYRRALRVFPQDHALWYQFVDFCLRSGSYSAAVNAIVEALGRHPHETALWLLASDRELKMGHLQSARTLLLRGLRATRYQDVAMWKFYMKFECEITLRLASAKLTAAENASAPRSEVLVDLQVPLLVATHVLGQEEDAGAAVKGAEATAARAAALKEDRADVHKFLCYCLHVSNSLMLSPHADHLLGVEKIAELCMKGMRTDCGQQPLFAAFGWKLKALQLKDASASDKADFLPAIMREVHASERKGDKREVQSQNQEITARLLALFTVLFVAADDRWKSLSEGYREASPCGNDNVGNSKDSRKRDSSDGSSAEEKNNDFDISKLLEIDTNPSEVPEESTDSNDDAISAFTPMADEEVSFWTRECNGEASGNGNQIAESLRRIGHLLGSRLADSEGTFLESCFLSFPKALAAKSAQEPELRLQLLVNERDEFWSVVCTEETLDHLIKEFLQNKVLVKRHSAAVPIAVLAAERLAGQLHEDGPTSARIRFEIRKSLQRAVHKWIPHDKFCRILHWKMKFEPLAESDSWDIVDFVEDSERFFSASNDCKEPDGKQLSALEGAELVKLACRHLLVDNKSSVKKRKSRKGLQDNTIIWKRFVTVLLCGMELQPFTADAGGTNSLVGMLKLMEPMCGQTADSKSSTLEMDMLDWILGSSFCLGASAWQRFSARAGFLEILLGEAMEQLKAISNTITIKNDVGDGDSGRLSGLDVAQKTAFRAVFCLEKLEQLVKDHEQRHFQRSSFTAGFTSKQPSAVQQKEKDAWYWQNVLQPRSVEAMEDAGVPFMCQKVAFDARKAFIEKNTEEIKEVIVALDVKVPNLGSRIMSDLPSGGFVRSLLHVCIKSIECS